MVAQALLERNTDSVTLMRAFPALHRAASIDPNSKSAFFLVMKFWLTFKEDRNPDELNELKKRNKKSVDSISSANILRFLVKAQTFIINREEKDALEVICANYDSFAPAEYLLGAL